MVFCWPLRHDVLLGTLHVCYFIALLLLSSGDQGSPSDSVAMDRQIGCGVSDRVGWEKGNCRYIGLIIKTASRCCLLLLSQSDPYSYCVSQKRDSAPLLLAFLESVNTTHHSRPQWLRPSLPLASGKPISSYTTHTDPSSPPVYLARLVDLEAFCSRDDFLETCSQRSYWTNSFRPR